VLRSIGGRTSRIYPELSALIAQAWQVAIGIEPCSYGTRSGRGAMGARHFTPIALAVETRSVDPLCCLPMLGDSHLL
jgi:hypothetical protein